MNKRFWYKAQLPFYLLLTYVLLSSHNLYLKMETYFLSPNQEARLALYNGTFEDSENIITRDRMLDASFVAQGQRVAIDSTQWQDQDSTLTYLNFRTGEAGTYVAGVSTRARTIKLTADKFNDYLEHDGVLDMLDYRRENNLLDQDAVESYQKHVKAIYQVGDTKTDDWSTVLGYPIEFVPQANPYEKYTGDKLSLQLLLDGKPLPNQLVYASHIRSAHGHTHGGQDHTHAHQHETGETHTHEHTHDEEGHGHDHPDGQQLRTDEQGLVTIDLPEDGIYYLRTIHMVSLPENDELTHESKWATLTFEVTHQHEGDDHAHEGEIPAWAFMLGSLLLVGLLFLLFSRKGK